MHKSSFMQMVLGYIPRSEGYIPLFFQGTIVLGTVVYIPSQRSQIKMIWDRIESGGKELFLTISCLDGNHM